MIGRAKGPPPAQPCISGAMRNCGMGCGCMAAALVRVRMRVRMWDEGEGEGQGEGEVRIAVRVERVGVAGADGWDVEVAPRPIEA